MSTITQTIARPQNNGRLLLLIEFDGGRTHSFEVDADPFHHAIAEILRAPSTTSIGATETMPALNSSFDPVRVAQSEQITSPS